MNEQVIKIRDNNTIHCKSNYGSFIPNKLPRGPYLQYKQHNRIEVEKRTSSADYMRQTTENVLTNSTQNIDMVTSQFNNRYVNTLVRKTNYHEQIPFKSIDHSKDKVLSVGEASKLDLCRTKNYTQSPNNNNDYQNESYPNVQLVQHTNILNSKCFSGDCRFPTRKTLFNAKHHGNLGRVFLEQNSKLLAQYSGTIMHRMEKTNEKSFENIQRYTQKSVTIPEIKTDNLNVIPRENSYFVSLSDILLVKTEGLQDDVGWALLCQSIQTLQDMFLTDNPIATQIPPILKSSSIQFTSRGQVIFDFQQVNNEPINHQHFAPEYKKNLSESHNYSEFDIEKMWIYSLGITLRESISSNVLGKFNGIKPPTNYKNHCDPKKIEPNKIINKIKRCSDVLDLQETNRKVNSIPTLFEVISTMCEVNPVHRASIMNLLNVITNYFQNKQNKKPVSHLIMDIVKELNQSSDIYIDVERTTHRKQTEFIKINSMKLKSLERDSNNKFNKDGVNCYKRNTKNRNLRNNFRRNTIDVNLKDLEKANKQFESKFDECISKSEGHLNNHQSSLLKLNQLEDPPHSNFYFCPEFILKLSQPSKLIKLSKSTNRRTINIVLVDSENIKIVCDFMLTTIGDLLEAITKAENYCDTFLLGLCSIIGGDFIFLPTDVKLIKIYPTTSGYIFFTLFLRIKFLLPSLLGLGSLQTTHMLYLQLRKSIIERQLHCNKKDLITLAGLALQAEVGNFTEMMQHMEYFAVEHYIPQNEILLEVNLRKYLINAHYSLRGMNQLEAEREFIQNVQKIKNYGYHFISATWIKNNSFKVKIFVGISLNGIALFERAISSDKSFAEVYQQFQWLEIQNLCFSKETLCITTRNREHLNAYDELVKFKIEFNDKKSCYAFNLASEHYKFYMKIKRTMSSIQTDDENILGKLFSDEHQKVESYEDNLKKDQKKKIDKCLNKFSKFLKRSNSNACNTKTKPTKQKFSMKNYFKLKEKSNSLSGMNVGEVFENQNNENECTKLENRFFESKGSHSPQIGKNPNRNHLKMGTRVFSEPFSNKLNTISPSIDKIPFGEVANTEDCDSLYDVIDANEPNEAYIIHSSIKSDSNEENISNNMAIPMNEIISESILESLQNHNISSTDRILKSVMVIKEPIIIEEIGFKSHDHRFRTAQKIDVMTKKYSLGISIVQGSENNNVYVKDLLKGGPGEKAGVNIGDQITAVNGISILSLPYNESLQILQTTGLTVDLVVSQSASVLAKDTNITCRSYQKSLPQSRNQLNVKQTIFEAVKESTEIQYATVKKKCNTTCKGTNSRKYSGPVRYPVTPLKPNIHLKF